MTKQELFQTILALIEFEDMSIEEFLNEFAYFLSIADIRDWAKAIISREIKRALPFLLSNQPLFIREC